MAFSQTLRKRDVVGSLVEEIYDVSFASVTSGAVVTGLKRLEFAAFQNSTTASGGVIASINSASASETEDDPGQVFLSGATSNDFGQVLVRGYP